MENILDVFEYLSAPFNSRNDDKKRKESPHTLVIALTERCWDKMQWKDLPHSHKTYMDNVEIVSSPSSSTWKLTCTILELLTQLRTHIEEAEANQSIEERSIEVLSLQNQLCIQKCVELVVGFGVLPYLLPGVGVPEKLRNIKNVKLDLFCDEDRQTTPLVQFFRLCHVIETLLTVSEHPSLGVLILPRHNCDILASLLQICKAPLTKPVNNLSAESSAQSGDDISFVSTTNTPSSSCSTEQSKVINTKSNKSPLTEEEYNCVLASREKLNIRLEKNFLVSSLVSKESLINSLFVVGSTLKPRWIGKSCYMILYSILLSSENSGLITISRATINSLGHSNIWKVTRVISNLVNGAVVINDSISKNDQNMLQEENVSERVSNISSQAYDMLINSVCHESSESSSLDQETQRCLTMIALTCGLKLLCINHQVTDKYFWSRLFEPLLNLSQTIMNESNTTDSYFSSPRTTASTLSSSSSCNNSNTTLVTIEKVETCTLVAEKLLNVAPAIDFSFPVNSFQSVWSVLFQLFVTCDLYLKRKVQEPRVADRVEKLHHKLESVLVNLFLVLDSISEAAISESDKESSTFLCEFCIHLILNDVMQTTATRPVIVTETAGGKCFSPSILQRDSDSSCSNFRVNRFQFDIVECLDDLCGEKEDENDKTRYSRDRGDTATSCPSSHNNSKSNNNKGDEIKVSIVRRFPSQNHHDDNNDDNNTYERLSDDCAILSSTIFKNIQVKQVTGKLFRQLLGYSEARSEEGEKKNKLNHEISNTTTTTSSHSSNTRPIYHSRILTKLDLQEKVQCQKFVAMKLLGDLGTDERIVEDMGAVENPIKTLQLLELIIKKLAVEMDSCAETGDEYEFSQSVVFSLGILGTLCETCGEEQYNRKNKNKTPSFSACSQGSSIDSNIDIWVELDRFTPYLYRFLRTSHLGLVNAGIPSMAENILMSIQSKGVLSKRKVERLSRFEEALEHVKSPMLPIKGHGLLELRRLVEERDQETLKNEEHLLQIFKDAIKNDDSYVYLMAIQGMATIGLKFHSIVVPILISEYGCFDESMSGKMKVLMNGDERAEFRMKIGEVLVKIIQRLGEMAPLYRVKLTNVFFHVVQDEDPLIRASALSNLGELCHLLKFTLGVILTEVWHCVESVLRFERHVEVRRGALHLIVLLLRGVQKDLPTDHLAKDRDIGQYLRDARRLLVRIRESETDAASINHVQLALDEMGLIALKILTPSDKMEYKIRVLDQL